MQCLFVFSIPSASATLRESDYMGMLFLKIIYIYIYIYIHFHIYIYLLVLDNAGGVFET